MADLPMKPRMAHYATEAMRQLLGRGEWSQRLPGERTLALRLGVSRPTLHQALLELETEGMLVRRKKSAWRITGDQAESRPGPRKIVFLSPLGLEDLDHFSLHQYTVLAAHLADRGHEIEPVRLSSAQGGKSARMLKALATQMRPSAWVLHRCSPSTQQWFAQSGLPVVVMGSTNPKLHIRSVDVDYRAAARHAANQLIRLGHRAARIAYLMPTEKLQGHVEAVKGLREASTEGEIRVIPTVDQPGSIIAAIDGMLHEATCPTALILHRPLQALTALGHLSRRGVRVPQQMSVLVLDDNPVLSHVVPSPTRYHKDTAHFATQLRKAIEQSTLHSSRGTWSIRIMPELISGETLSAPKES